MEDTEHFVQGTISSKPQQSVAYASNKQITPVAEPTPALHAPGNGTDLNASASTPVLAHEIGYSPRRAGGGYSNLPEAYGDITIGQADPRDPGDGDAILAQIEEEERQLHERERRLLELERLDGERRELRRRREQRLAQLK